MEVIFEDNHLIAVNKQVSELVQGDRTGDVSLDVQLKEFLKKKYNKPGNVFLGVIHRLDRPVTGVVIYAKTSKALSRMNRMFKENAVSKVYWAIVKEPPEILAGELRHFIVRDRRKNKSYSYEEPVLGAKEGWLDYKLIAQSENYSLLEIELHTGRHHQIRSQLTKIGSPILGDLKYGFPRSNKSGGISLHARTLSFLHPVKKEPVKITAKPPEENLWNVFVQEVK
ncbi:MAG: RluA family pseudouridine synthase [Bacteroidetes bacterium]|nr:RluA family pseudouridine synthase [Bacteroidota bacterium]